MVLISQAYVPVGFYTCSFLNLWSLLLTRQLYCAVSVPVLPPSSILLDSDGHIKLTGE